MDVDDDEEEDDAHQGRTKGTLRKEKKIDSFDTIVTAAVAIAKQSQERKNPFPL